MSPCFRNNGCIRPWWKKYTIEERRKIENAKLEFEKRSDGYIFELKGKFKSIDWDSKLEEEALPDDLRHFIDSYFDSITIAEDNEEDAPAERDDSEMPGSDIQVRELQALQTALQEKNKEMETATSSKKRELQREANAVKSKATKLHRQLAETTLAGKLWVVLNDSKATQAFRKYWVDEQVVAQLDYPIFFGINRKPVKDERGEYWYIRTPTGELLLNKNGHPVIDHDLQQIAEGFVKFAKEQGFDFWG